MQPLTQKRLVDLLQYNPDTGIFFWKSGTRKIKVGSVAGTKNGRGYIQICINGKLYMAHRLAWLYVHGDMPSMDIDHIDGNRANNEFTNLRHVSRSINLQNQRDVRGGKAQNAKLGASFVKSTGRWHARIKVGNKQLSLGCFSSMQEAHEKYLLAKRTMHQGCTI